MPPHAPATAQDHVDAYVAGKLDAVARRIRLVDAASALCMLAALGAAYALGMVIADHLLDGGIPLLTRRIAAGLTAGLLLSGMFWRVVRPALRPLNDRYVARLIEKHYPDLRNELITLLDVGGKKEVHAGVVASVLERAARDLSGKPTAVAVQTRSLFRTSVLIAALFVSLLLYSAFATKAVLPSLARVFGADIAAPTRTQVAWLAPDENLSVVQGTPITLQASVSGQRPDRVLVEYTSDDGVTWSAQPPTDLLPPTTATGISPTWSATLPGRDVRSPLTCRIRAADALSPIRRIDVRPVPAEAEMSFTLQPPAYTGLPEVVSNEADLDVLVGTRVVALVRANVPVRGGLLRLDEVNGRKMRTLDRDAADLNLLRTQWVAESDAEFRVELRDIYGVPNAQSPPHRQVVRLDAAPIIEMAAPLGDLDIDADAAFDIRAAARDDFGLARIELVFGSGARVGRLALNGTGPTARKWEVASRVTAASLGAKPGDVVDCRLEAIDNHQLPDSSAAPQTAVGPNWRVRVNAVQLAQARSKKGDTPDPSQGKADGETKSDTDDQKGDGNSDPQEMKAGAGQGDGPDGDHMDGKSETGRETGDADKPAGNGGGTEPPMDKNDVEKLVRQMEKGGGADQPDGAQGEEQGGDKQGGDNADSRPDADKPDAKSKSKNSGDSKSGPDSPKNGDNPAEGEKPSDADKPGEMQQPPKPDAGDKSKAKPDAEDGKPKDKPDSGDNQPGDNKEQKPGKQEAKGDGQSPPNPGDGKAGDAGKDKTDKPGEQGKPSEDGKPNEQQKAAGGDKGKSEEPKAEKSADGKSGEGKSGDGKSGDNESKGDKSEGAESKEGQPKGGERPPDEARDKAPGSESKSNGDQSQADNAKGQQPAGQQPAGEKPGGQQPGGQNPGGQNSGGQSPGDEKPGAGDQPPTRGEPGQQSGGGIDKPRTGASDDAKPPAKPTNDGEFDGGGAKSRGEQIGADRVERAVNELERRMREGKLDDEMLRDLGWTRADAERFVRQYRRDETASKGGPARTNPASRMRRAGTRDDAAAVRRPGQGGDALTGGPQVVTGGKPSTPTVKEIAAEEVPPELRDLLDGYYRTMAREEPPAEPKPRP